MNRKEYIKIKVREHRRREAEKTNVNGWGQQKRITTTNNVWYREKEPWGLISIKSIPRLQQGWAKWRVWATNPKVKKFFKTKREALDYVEFYMVEYPNG